MKDTANILNEKGYDYYYFKEEGIKPETVKLFLCGNLKTYEFAVKCKLS